jgi:hypothetical protein
MTVDVEEIGIITYSSDNVLVPDLGEQRATGLFQGTPSLRLLRPAAQAANRRFARPLFRSQRVASKHDGLPSR